MIMDVNFVTRRVLIAVILGLFVVHTHGSSKPWKLPKVKSPSNIPLLRKNSSKEPKTPRRRSATAIRLPALALCHLVLAAESTAVTANKLSVDLTAVISTTNLIIHYLWHTADEKKDAEMRKFLDRHFVLLSDDLSNGRVHPLLLSAFSHRCKIHLVSNLSVLTFFGPMLSKQLGTRRFSYFYMASIYASDLFDQIIYSRFYRKNVRIGFWKIPIGSLGASGAISALITYSCLMDPRARLDVAEMLDLDRKLDFPSWFVLAVHWATDLIPQSGSNIANGSHLGGHIFGLIVYSGVRLWKYIVRQHRRRKKSPIRKWTERNLLGSKRRRKKRGIGVIFLQLTMWKKQVTSAWEYWIDKIRRGLVEVKTTVLEELQYQLKCQQKRQTQMDRESRPNGRWNETNTTLTTGSHEDNNTVDEPLM